MKNLKTIATIVFLTVFVIVLGAALIAVPLPPAWDFVIFTAGVLGLITVLAHLYEDTR